MGWSFDRLGGEFVIVKLILCGGELAPWRGFSELFGGVDSGSSDHESDDD